jgi:hypothetical protein
MTRLELLAALNKFALNSDYYGYNWADLFNDAESNKTFEDYNNEELLALYNDYNNYIKGE